MERSVASFFLSGGARLEAVLNAYVPGPSFYP
jgi:hypothetical protein